MAAVAGAVAGLFGALFWVLMAIAVWRRFTGRRRTSLPSLLPWYLGGHREIEVAHPPEAEPRRR